MQIYSEFKFLSQRIYVQLSCSSVCLRIQIKKEVNLKFRMYSILNVGYCGWIEDEELLCQQPRLQLCPNVQLFEEGFETEVAI
jgi:hypothetical protein